MEELFKTAKEEYIKQMAENKEILEAFDEKKDQEEVDRLKNFIAEDTQRIEQSMDTNAKTKEESEMDITTRLSYTYVDIRENKEKLKELEEKQKAKQETLEKIHNTTIEIAKTELEQAQEKLEKQKESDLAYKEYEKQVEKNQLDQKIAEIDQKIEELKRKQAIVKDSKTFKYEEAVENYEQQINKLTTDKSAIDKSAIDKELQKNQKMINSNYLKDKIKLKREFGQFKKDMMSGKIVETKKKEATPVIEKTAPVVEKTAPAVEETAPAVEETAPVVEETTPVVEETAPAVEETAPAVEETAPAVEETAPVVEETAPVVEETTPAVEETARRVETVDKIFIDNKGKIYTYDIDEEWTAKFDGMKTTEALTEEISGKILDNPVFDEYSETEKDQKVEEVKKLIESGNVNLKILLAMTRNKDQFENYINLCSEKEIDPNLVPSITYELKGLSKEDLSKEDQIKLYKEAKATKKFFKGFKDEKGKPLFQLEMGMLEKLGFSTRILFENTIELVKKYLPDPERKLIPEKELKEAEEAALEDAKTEQPVEKSTFRDRLKNMLKDDKSTIEKAAPKKEIETPVEEGYHTQEELVEIMKDATPIPPSGARAPDDDGR